MSGAKLSRDQEQFLLMLRRKGLAYQTGYGWRLKGERESMSHRLGEALLSRNLATIITGHGSAQLRLTPIGAAVAVNLSSKPRRATCAS